MHPTRPTRKAKVESALEIQYWSTGTPKWKGLGGPALQGLRESHVQMRTSGDLDGQPVTQVSPKQAPNPSPHLGQGAELSPHWYQHPQTQPASHSDRILRPGPLPREPLFKAQKPLPGELRPEGASDTGCGLAHPSPRPQLGPSQGSPHQLGRVRSGFPRHSWQPTRQEAGALQMGGWESPLGLEPCLRQSSPQAT